HVAEHLSGAGETVRVLDNFLTGKRHNLDSFRDRIELIEGDLRDPAACRQACKGIEIVLHQAALPSVPKSVSDPIASHQCNVDGTLNLLIAAKDCGVRRVVVAASSSAYGESPTLPKVETMKSDPLSPYAVQKLATEQYARAWAKCYGLRRPSVRYFTVFVPRQDPTSQYAAAIPSFVTSILRGQPPVVFGDGEQTRDFTYIENVVRANVLAATAPTADGTSLNIACGERITINRVIARINELLGTRVQPRYVDARPGDIKHSLADISLAKKVIGYAPTISFDDGLSRSIDWYRKTLA